MRNETYREIVKEVVETYLIAKERGDYVLALACADELKYLAKSACELEARSRDHMEEMKS